MRACCVLVALGLAAAGCKPRPKTDDRPNPDPDTLLAEQERIARGEKVGEALRAPKLVVDAQSILVNGHRVAARAELPADSARKVDPLFAWMKGLREHWKTIHPGQPFTPLADVTLPVDLGFHQGASFLKTLAFSGYPGVTLASGGEKLSFAMFVPGPPRPDEAPDQNVERHLELCHSSGWHVRYSYLLVDAFATNPWGLPESEPAATPPPRPALPWRSADSSELGAAVRELCGPGCSRLVVGSADAGPAWISAAVMLGAALRASAPPPPLAFAPCSVEPPAPPVEPPPPAKDAGPPEKIRVRVGALSVSAGLTPESVQAVLAPTLEPLRRCYAVGQARNPMLQGRISVRLTIDENGIVSNVGNAGSDLPDSGVVRCALQAFRLLRFAKPDSGAVTVVQPYLFTPE